MLQKQPKKYVDFLTIYRHIEEDMLIPSTYPKAILKVLFNCMFGLP